MKLVMVVGAATPPGRLNNAIETLAAAIAARPDCASETINLAGSGIEICDGRKIEDYNAPTRAAVDAVLAADAVLLASPVYRASFPGVLKNLLDLLPVEALRDKPVGILAMGGSAHHYLGVDWHLRMVLTWFGAVVMPNSVYLTGRDFAEGKLSSAEGRADLLALADTLFAFADSGKGRSYCPAPLAARFT